MAELQMLDCSDTQVSDLRPLASLHSLQALYCHRTPVSYSRPAGVAGSAADAQLLWDAGLGSRSARHCSIFELQTLMLSDTPVLDLEPIASLIRLRTLYCSNTQVSDLGPLASLIGLRALYCSNLRRFQTSGR